MKSYSTYQVYGNIQDSDFSIISFKILTTKTEKISEYYLQLSHRFLFTPFRIFHFFNYEYVLHL